MIERGQRAILVGTHPQGLPRRRPVTDRAIHLLAPEHELDRPPDHTGRHDAENLRSGNKAFAAEAATEEWTADVNVARRYSEDSRQASLRHEESLTRCIDGKCVAIPCRPDGMRLHRIVILGWGRVLRFDPFRSGGEAGLDIAPID